MVVEKKGIDYQTYVFRQGRKITAKRQRFLNSIPGRIRKFEGIFNRAKKFLNPGAVICLGARTGCEVQAARNLGFAGSIGIDLYPAREGDGLVVRGDWHNIPFPSGSFDDAFTNSIDHCFDLDMMIKEIRRVLKDGGILFLMLSRKQMLSGKSNKDEYMIKSANFLFWEDGDDLVHQFNDRGFVLIKWWNHGHNWQSYILRKE